ncbi:MAG: glycerophosphodiester phosphodiesterase [Dysgonamonadaceae bacterium]|jgi:glycerophosphoryl diester phosphodiesterase|nr:glycerophosphodiester phosphodiesterase [Dysgonamonadaceae bacterium]
MTKKITFFALLWLAVFSVSQAQVKVVAHRGYWKVAGSAQNSLAAFAKADSIGAFGSEFDVWMTADGKLVVNHDGTFKGVSMEKGTLSEIRKIRLDNGEQLPTLDEYLKSMLNKPNTRVVLEMKSLSNLSREDEAAQKIVKALKKYKLLNRTDIIAFSINACLAFKKLLPDTKIYYLDGDLSPRKIKNLGLAGIDYSMNALRQHPEWVEESHKLGLEVNVWTVNKEEDMKYFIELGVDIITTDQPEELQKLLR